VYQKLIEGGLTLHIIIVFFILGMYFSINRYGIPLVAQGAVIIFPESYDNKLGRGIFNEFMSFNDIDTQRTVALQKFADQLDLGNSKELKFTVVKSSVVNAFSLPDGNIVMYTGILNVIESSDELVALIGHEAAHVNNRHSLKMLCQNLAGYLFISVVLSDVNGIMGIITDNAHQLQSLSFSREFEIEADEDGFEILINNGCDPNGMPDLFSHLQTDHDKYIPEFLSTHPITDERINNIKKIISNNTHMASVHNELDLLFIEVKKDIVIEESIIEELLN